MKAVIIYSGKGGVGKTTTTANIARLLAKQGNAVQQCYNAFGIRVGLGDNWEDIYDGWNKEMK